MKKSGLSLPAAAVICVLFCGCSATMSERQLESVAKDWCMTIRASQVIPVYPLTEDLQPGDVFLVQIPIQKQEELYRGRGFLPLDQLLVRLKDLDYKEFYFASYFEPYYTGSVLERPKPDPNSQDRRFRSAPLPMAAFPSYTFDVDTSTGVRVALPVKGIPVGMGLMNASSVTGSITISDGMTYAIGTEEVLRCLKTWANQADVRRLLCEIRSTTESEVYLRVVTRVYVVGAVDVSLIRKHTGGAGAEAGDAPTVHLVNLRAQDANDATAKVTAYQKVLDELSEPMASAVPGGSLRIAWASGNMVTLKEKFPRLLAVGYLGFDVPVRKDGTLGSLVATRDHIDPAVALRPVPKTAAEPVAWITILNLYRMLDTSDSSKNKELARSMDGLFEKFALPNDITLYELSFDSGNNKYFMSKRFDLRGYDNENLQGFLRLNALYGLLTDSIKVLEKTVKGGFIKQNGQIVKPSPEQIRQYRVELNYQYEVRQSLVETVRRHQAVREALEIFFGDVLYNQ